MAGSRRAAPKEERLFSLILALVASPEGATKATLLSSVHGYAGRSQQGASAVAIDRQFERDKEELRGLGIPIETLDSPLEPGNNQLTRYRISKDLLQLPTDLTFSERELMLLRLAAIAWRDGTLGAEARRATMKLESLGAGVDVRHLGVAPKLGITDPTLGPLQQAIETRSVAGFDYRVPGQAAATPRRVAPLRLHRADARWHLIAWDLDRDAARTFLLSRIKGRVTAERKTFDPALLAEAARITAELERLRESRRAKLRVTPGSVAEARLTPRAAGVAPSGEGLLDLGTLDYHELAEELVSYGDEVVVEQPDELRALVAQGLEQIAVSYGA